MGVVGLLNAWTTPAEEATAAITTNAIRRVLVVFWRRVGAA